MTMSEKNLDAKGRWRNITIAFRVSPEENDNVNMRVRLSGLTKQDYMTRRCTEKDIVVVGNPRVHKALKTQMELIYQELTRLTSADEISEELTSAIALVAKTFDALQHTDAPMPNNKNNRKDSSRHG